MAILCSVFIYCARVDLSRCEFSFYINLPELLVITACIVQQKAVNYLPCAIFENEAS